MQMFIVPSLRIFINVFPTSFIILSITNDMLGRRALKHFFDTVFLLATTRSQGLKRTDHIIQGRGGACSSRLLMQEYNRMDMVGHNDIVFNRNARKRVSSKCNCSFTISPQGFNLIVNSGGASPSPTDILIVLSVTVRSVLTISDRICILSRTHIVTKYAPLEL